MEENGSPEMARPLPQRPFTLTPAASTESSQAPTPPTETNTSANFTNSHLPSEYPRLPSGQRSVLESTLHQNAVGDMAGSTPSRTRSILNLTSSTLFGIYSPTGYDSNNVNASEPSTPWGTGAETPARGISFEGTRPSQSQLLSSSAFSQDAKSSAGFEQRRRSNAHFPRRPRGFRNYVLPMISRSIALFAAGVVYGSITRHLHDSRHIAPVKVEGIDRGGWLYGAFWGMAGVGLGWGLPWVDTLFYGDEEEDADGQPDSVGEKREREGRGTAGRRVSARTQGWDQVVRSVGAFVGIAFAIRRLPWQSTLQVSLTLALVNPVIWYLLDRTKPGFLLSTVVGILGAATLLLVNPDIVPPPATPSRSTSARISDNNGTAGVVAQNSSSGWAQGLVTNEMVGVATWIASVLFCSCVCFGNIGRRLAPGKSR